ncbi:MAG: lipoprotein [Bacilli bacterium]|nr:lipoprotein [Bacilli bacterium]
MKKILLLLTIILLVSGCTTKYEIRIKNDSIEDTLTIDNLIFDGYDPNADDSEEYYDSNRFIYDVITSDVLALDDTLADKKVYYKKEINQNGNSYNLKFNYEYKFEDFSKSYVINSCFENRDIKIVDDKVYIHLSGHFYCYYDEPIDIVIKSDKYVKKSNGKKSGSGYHWEINQDNYNDIDILIETSNISKSRHFIYYAIAIIAGIVCLLFIIHFVGKLLGKDDVNSI